ncbi:MAG: alanine racemase [Candidatus Cloacimonetes bacterium]|nr:alanine racemase [Candidatus Cloacimonadota bacterium]
MRSWVEIDLSAFAHNFEVLKGFLRPDVEIMQIVKADAYGHGAAEIAEKALAGGATWLGVANADEGALLRLQDFECPILILSPSLVSEIPLIIENRLTPAVSELDFAEKLSAAGQAEYNIHLNIDTGMGRSGVRLKEADELYHKIAKLKNLVIEGIFTHFAAAENDPEYTETQIIAFHKFISSLPVKPKYIHSANSSAVLAGKLLQGNLVRLGALTYGFYTDDSQKDKISLRPVMSFKSRVSQIKMGQKGEYIGYNKTYCCPEDMRYAIIPVGYADGYDFLLSNLGKVMIKGNIVPVIGKVSMDLIAVDISSLPSCETGCEVMLLGAENELHVDDITALYKGSPYELLCQMGRRARRFFFENGKLVASAPRLRREFVSTDYDDQKLNRIIESAIAQRLQSSEIADFITEDLIKNIFRDRDKQIDYRHDFRHKITFRSETSPGFEDYFVVKTELRYCKKLSGSHFIIACANDEAHLSEYFLKPQVEYRWLLDSFLPLSKETFLVDKIMVNGLELETSYKKNKNCLEIHCHNDKLSELTGEDVDFLITTTTFYPRSYHQLSVFITDITCGYAIEFNYPQNLKMESIIPIFSGRDKFPELQKTPQKILASSSDWVFPLSGIVFVYT